MTETFGALVGLFAGLIFGGAGWFWGRKMASKKRGLDERYHLIQDKARATSWQITLAAMYILFLLLIIFKFDISAARTIGMLMLVHMTSWAVLVFYYGNKY